jgi:tetratricopeptide (TPR) repeat protein
MRRLSYNAVCGIVLACLMGGLIASFFFVRRLRPREFKRELSAVNALYEKGDYKRCIIAYENLASRYNIRCMTLYYNLGNAYYLTGDLGRAILYYRKAQVLAPRDRQVADNLRIAQAEAKVTIRPEQSEASHSFGRRLTQLFSLFEGVAASLTFRWLLVISVVLAVFFARKRRWLVRVSIVLAVLFYLSVGVTVYKAYVQESSREAVVLAQFAPVRSKPDRSGATTEVLPQGTTIEVKSRRDGWCQVALGNGKLGWIEESVLGEI